MVVAAMLLAPVQAMAQEEASDRPDARVEGFVTGENNTVGRVIIDGGGGHATTWFILAGLGLLGLVVMFKSGRRTHLD
jgi:hypothetical protein